ncbi:MAG: bile acid:sodium symporter family protein [Pacificimonas sp.]
MAAATFVPVAGKLAQAMNLTAYALIMLMFFFHGVRLPGRAIVQAVTNWRLHGAILAVTFLAFPLAGFLLREAGLALLPAGIAAGLLYLTLVPSTVQASVAFTAVGQGNVAASVAAASTSNILGVFVTPALVAVLMGAGAGAGVSPDAALKVVALLLAPFIAGHLLRRWLSEWAGRNKRLLGLTDKGAIMLIVYTAFSAAVLQGVWTRLGAGELAQLFGLCLLLLTVVTGLLWLLARRFPADMRATLIFCGGQKSLAAGAPMASLLFATPLVGELLLPLMIYHQAQLVLAALIAPYLAQSKPIMS